MKLQSLNARGFAHHIAIVGFVVIFSIIGVGYLVASHADSCQTPVSSATSNAVSSGRCPVSGAVSGPSIGPRSEQDPLYRMYNGGNRHHFYTTNKNEMLNTQRSYGYKLESIEGYVWRIQKPGTVALYRSVQPTTHDYFYTNNANTNAAAKAYGYQSQGVIGYVYAKKQAKTAPLYRMYNGKTRDHFYTNNAATVNTAKKYGYKYETIEGYVNL